MKDTQRAYQSGYRITAQGRMIDPQGQPVTGAIKDGLKLSTINCSGVSISIYHHELQAYQKYGNLLFEDGNMIHHKNRLLLDNAWENISLYNADGLPLEVPEQVIYDNSLHGHRKPKRTKYNHTAIKQFHEACRSYKKTMDHFGIKSKGTLHKILKK